MCKKALEIAIKKNNSNKKAESYYYIAKVYAFYRQFDESNFYLEKGLNEHGLKKDVLLYAKFLGLKADYYSRMPLTEESYKYDLKILKLLSSKKDLESKILIAKSYMYIGQSTHPSAASPILG